MYTNRQSVTRTLVLAAALAMPGAQAGVFNASPAFPSPPPGVDEPPQGEWLGELAIGFNATSGNTETSSLNARLLLGYLRDKWRHTVNLNGNRASDATGTIGERYQLTGQSDYRISEIDYVFITAQGERDRFAGISLRTSEAVGYGRDLLKTDRHRLNAEVGAGARQVRFTDNRRETEGILRLAGGYVWTISENSEFSQRLVVEAGDENTYSESITALKTNLVGRIYSNISFTVKHNGTVPAGREKTDTYTALQLQYRF
ncbi:MAG: DUF481 domain-containing protein [Xanthomonadaceae bacterium]|nr:DUF481 domain-containing protein [Xanthomonadaceae bacterium]